MTKLASSAARIDRSYDFQVSGVRPGDLVRLTESAFYGGPIPAGTDAVLVGFSNDGFNGIRARIELADGRNVTVSAGSLEIG